jgi:hypothetical protein
VTTSIALVIGLVAAALVLAIGQRRTGPRTRGGRGATLTISPHERPHESPPAPR